MPPYRKPVSESQRRKMFVLAEHGDIPLSDALGKSRAVKGEDLPYRVRRKSRAKRGRR